MVLLPFMREIIGHMKMGTYEGRQGSAIQAAVNLDMRLRSASFSLQALWEMFDFTLHYSQKYLY